MAQAEDTCQRCGQEIVLAKMGKTERSYKWVTNPAQAATWKCGSDPAFPVRGHAPTGPARRDR